MKRLSFDPMTFWQGNYDYTLNMNTSFLKREQLVFAYPVSMGFETEEMFDDVHDDSILSPNSEKRKRSETGWG